MEPVTEIVEGDSQMRMKKKSRKWVVALLTMMAGSFFVVKARRKQNRKTM